MSPYTPEEIEQRFTRLPEPLKDEMMSVENSERIFEVGKKFGLTIEQIGFLAEESGYVVLGLTHPNDFVARLKDHLHVDEEKAKTIAREINHQVFFPLREMLKNTHQFDLTQEQIQASPPPIPPMPRTQPISPEIPPTPLPKPPIIPTPVSPSPRIAPPIQKTIAPIPLPPRPPEPVVSAPIKPPLPPIDSPHPPLLTQRDLSAIEEKKSEIPALSTLQEEPRPVGRPAIPPIPKPIGDIKQKEISVPPTSSSPAPQQPKTPDDKQALPPSQIMQKRLLEDTKRVKTPMQPDVERIKESLFALPSAPAQPKPATQSTPPAAQSSVPAPAPLQKSPSSYSTHDPYREPIE